MHYRAKQSGIALITVLLIAVIATVVVVEMNSSQQLDIRRTGNRQALQQAGIIAQGAEHWAIGILVKDVQESKHDSLDEGWATVLPPMPVPGGTVSGQIEDLQSRININNLLTDQGQIEALEVERLQRLFKVLSLESNIVYAIQDWFDRDSDPSGQDGAEDDYYAGLEHPYRTANRKFVSISELRLIRGIDDEVYSKLAPFVSVLPTKSSVNVNTASAEVLQALHKHVDAAAAEQLIEDRDTLPFDNPGDYKNHAVHNGQPVNINGVSVNSNFFQLQAKVELGRTRLIQSTWLERKDTGRVRIMQRFRGNQ